VGFVPPGIEHANRTLLERLHRAFPGPFDLGKAEAALGLERARTRRLLAYFAERGWLSRVRRGLYVTVPLGAASPREWRADPWQVALAAFAPCYVAGWSACEHWGLTEQIFRETVVVTAGRVRSKHVTVQGASFRLKSRPIGQHFGLATVWRGGEAIPVSDVERTIVDVLDVPELGGGARHVAEILAAWSERDDRNESRLIQYAERLGNGAAFKRLGYLLEVLSVGADELIEACRKRISTGLSKLDPSIHAKGRIDKRWNLRVNAHVSGRGDSD